MKKIICIWGASNYGKTSSIIEFDNILNRRYANNIVTVHSAGTPPYDILRIYKIGNITVGIESQ